MAAGARAWATEIGTRLALPVTMRDERLSSFEAERRLGRMPRGRSGGAPSRAQRNAYRARIDREAAAVILQDELDARARRRGEHPERSGAAAIPSTRSPRPRSDARTRTSGPAGTAAGPGDQRRYERYGDRRGGVGGIVRFLLFLFVLAAVVLVVMAHRRAAARCARSSCRGRGTTPPRSRLGFVSDLVREDLGAALTAPASDDDTDGRVRRRARRHADDPRAASSRRPGSSPASGRSCTRPAQDDLAAEAQRRPVLARPEPDAGRGRRRPRQQPDRDAGDPGHLPRGPARRADDGEAADDPAAPTSTRRRSTTS